MTSLAKRRARRRKAVSKRRSRPRSPRIVEARYERTLVKISRNISKVIDKALVPVLRDAAKREDAEIPPTFARDFGSVRIRIMRLVGKREVSPIVDQFGREKIGRAHV